MQRIGIIFAHVGGAPAAGHDRPPPLAEIARTLPPPEEAGAVSEAAKAALMTRVTALRERMAGQAGHTLLPDVGALVKAVEFALCFGEWYKEGDDAKVTITALSYPVASVAPKMRAHETASLRLESF